MVGLAQSKCVKRTQKKPRTFLFSRRIDPLLWAALFLGGFGPAASAQLAITEIMSFASTNGLERGLQRPDFWELTNFGTNEISLDGYRWFDADEPPFELRNQLPATTLGPGKSIIFVRDNPVILDASDFRNWWGLPADLQIYFWLGNPGFDNELGDAVRLWDANSNLVDEAHFDAAQMGLSFTYDTNTGAFSEFSQPGVAGAFRSAEGEDVGSPGYATQGAVALRFTQQPTNESVDAGSDLTLKVQATGRPAPQYQWHTNGVPIPAMGPPPSAVPRLVCFLNCGTSWRRAPEPNDLVLQSIQPWQGGNYHVEAFNGRERITSSVVAVSVNSNSSPLQVDCPPAEDCVSFSGSGSLATLVATPGQTAIFTVQHRGFPLPTFQWSRSVDGINFTNLPGETRRDLTLPNLQPSDAGTYRIRLENSLGTTTAVARLILKPTPGLAITEVMAHACSALNLDWWELTNTNTEPVNLCGYRWDDGTHSIGGGPTITNEVILQPGASVIFLENQTAASFIQWWGAANLPPDLQFVTYRANGLGESGDSIHVWDPNETDLTREVAEVVFSGAVFGRTEWFDSECGGGESSVTSSNAVCGAFQANLGCEIGSPGWTRWTPPTLTSVRREETRAVLNWSAQPGSLNRVQFARQLGVPLTATVWEDLGEFQSALAACVGADSNIGTETQRFYRVVRVAAAHCPCPPPPPPDE